MKKYPKNITHVVVGMDGEVMSRHTSSDKAQAAIDAEWRGFTKRYHYTTGGYLPRSIIRVINGEVHCCRCHQYSTSWMNYAHKEYN